MVVAKHSIFRLTPRKESLKTRLDWCSGIPHVAVTFGSQALLCKANKLPLLSVFSTFISLWLSPTMIREFFSGSQGKISLPTFRSEYLKDSVSPWGCITLQRKVYGRGRLGVSPQNKSPLLTVTWFIMEVSVSFAFSCPVHLMISFFLLQLFPASY